MAFSKADKSLKGKTSGQTAGGGGLLIFNPELDNRYWKVLPIVENHHIQWNLPLGVHLKSKSNEGHKASPLVPCRGRDHWIFSGLVFENLHMLTVDDGICKLALLKGMGLKKESKMAEIDHSPSPTLHFFVFSVPILHYQLLDFKCSKTSTGCKRLHQRSSRGFMK